MCIRLFQIFGRTWYNLGMWLRLERLWSELVGANFSNLTTWVPVHNFNRCFLVARSNRHFTFIFVRDTVRSTDRGMEFETLVIFQSQFSTKFRTKSCHTLSGHMHWALPSESSSHWPPTPQSTSLHRLSKYRRKCYKTYLSLVNTSIHIFDDDENWDNTAFGSRK